MYDFVRGPFLWISAVIFIAGFVYRAIRLVLLTDKKTVMFSSQTTSPIGKLVSLRSEEERKLDRIARIKNSVFVQHPVMSLVSVVFHFCLFVTPLFLLAHNSMIESAFGIMPPSLPEGLTDLMTIIVLACGLFFLIRRIAVPKVAAISSGYDYIVLLITILPYLTGFLAYHQLFTYKIMMTLHIFAGEIMLIALPFTKIGHMVFFFFSRLALEGEYCLGRGRRTWSN